MNPYTNLSLPGNEIYLFTIVLVWTEVVKARIHMYLKIHTDSFACILNTKRILYSGYKSPSDMNPS